MWDALADSLWSGLDECDTEKIAIIWPESTAIANSAPDDFSIAREALSQIADSLADSTATVGHPKQVAIVLL